MDFVTLLANLRSVINGYYTTLTTKLTAVRTMVVNHIRDGDNPHRLNKGHVQLDRVENYPPATRDVALEGISHAHYMTPRRSREVNDIIVDELTQAFDDAADDLTT